MTNNQITVEAFKLYKNNNMYLNYGFKHIRPEMIIRLVSEETKTKANRWLYLLELLLGKATIVGFKSSFSLNIR